MARAEAEAKTARDRRIAERKAKMQAGDVSPVDHFNAAHSVADLLALRVQASRIIARLEKSDAII